MRLFLLPISTKRTLIYCERVKQQLASEQSYLDKVTARASATWVKWEKHEKGWQRTLTQYGNKLFARIPYEEWGLKSIPPLSARRQADELEGKETVQVAFPRSLIKHKSVSDVMRRLGSERQALHKKMMLWSIVGMPFTAPVALIPVLPNIPFFYLCFRAWSHWRALSGSKHVEFLLDHKLIQKSPSPLLDTLYSIARVDAALSGARREVERLRAGRDHGEAKLQNTSDPHGEEMLLSQSSGRLIAETLEVPELEMEIERAIAQVERSLAARAELVEEKLEMESASKGAESEVKR